MGDNPNTVKKQIANGNAEIVVTTYEGYPAWYTLLVAGRDEHMLIVFDKANTKAILYLIPLPKIMPDDMIKEAQDSYAGQWRIVSADSEYVVWANYERGVIMAKGVNRPSLIVCDQEGFQLIISKSEDNQWLKI